MSKFTQEEQTQIVKGAMELTATIEHEERELNNVQGQTFRKLPEPPMQKVLPSVAKIQPQYPAKPKTKYTYKEFVKETLNLTTTKRKIGAIAVIILAGWLIGIFLIYSIFAYLKKVNQLNSELENSSEYLEARAEAERIAQNTYEEKKKERDEEQAKLDLEFEQAKNHYDNVIVPEYNEEHKKWNEQKQMKIGILKNEISFNKETLSALYDSTKIISAHYRELWILDWLYSEMSTSDHDIRYATELLDRDRQRMVTEESGQRTQAALGRMEQSMMAGFGAVYNAIEVGNDIQADTLSMLSKTRRDNNIGHFIGTVQRHNTNKMLEELVPKKRK